MAIPAGFQFWPDNEQLLCLYLKNKLLQRPLPCDVIKEAEVYEQHPEKLAAQYLMANDVPEWFFFTRIEMNECIPLRLPRSSGPGRWKSTKAATRFHYDLGGVSGYRQNFYYMESREPSWEEEKTIWLMEEYRIQRIRGSPH